MTSTTKPGTRWFAAWLRDRRRAAGLSREGLVRVCRRAGQVVTVPILQDIERGSRLPTRARTISLAAAFELPPWVLHELVRLAAHVEPGWERHREHREAEPCLELSAHLRAAGRDAEAAACAELAVRSAQAPLRQNAELALGRALIGVGFADLAAWYAGRVLEQPGPGTGRREALVLGAEAAVAAGRPTTAGVFLERAQRLERGAPAALRAREQLLAAQIALAAGRTAVALENAMRAIDRLPPRARERRCAVECVAGALRRQGRQQEARRWLSRLLEDPVPPPGPPPGVAPRRLGD
jgi:transcriptional regulator with XRE-family HTH domain